MLVHIKGFKSISKTDPVLDSAAKLYSLRVPDGKGQQEVKLKDKLLDKYVFCQVDRETTGYQIVLEKRMTGSTLRSQMRRVGEITGFEDIVKPYCLRYAGAKTFNNSSQYLFRSLVWRIPANVMNRGSLQGSSKCYVAAP